MFKIFKTAEQKKAAAEEKAKKKNESLAFVNLRVGGVPEDAEALLLLSKVRGEMISQNSHRDTETKESTEAIAQIDSKIKEIVYRIAERDYTYISKKDQSKFMAKAAKKAFAKKYLLD